MPARLSAFVIWALFAATAVYGGWHLAVHWSNWVLGFAIFDFVTLLLVLNEWRQPGRPRRTLPAGT